MLVESLQAKASSVFTLQADGNLSLFILANTKCRRLQTVNLPGGDMAGQSHEPSGGHSKSTHNQSYERRSIKTVQLGFLVLFWLDPNSETFTTVDFKRRLVLRADLTSHKTRLPLTTGISFDRMTRRPTLVSSQRQGNEDKFLLASIIQRPEGASILRVDKVNFLRHAVQEQEEEGGFKPPLFLIGIGLAILYQVFFAPSKKRESRLTRTSRKHAISKNIDDMSKFARRFNK